MKLNYKSFADDELLYLANAYNSGLRYTAMVQQAHRICELYLKQVIENSLYNNNQEVMLSHSLLKLYTYITESVGIDLSHIRKCIMEINYYSSHTKYPGRELFIATEGDITTCFLAIGEIVKGLRRLL